MSTEKRLQEIMGRLPANVRPIVEEYGTFLIGLGLDEAIGLIDLIVTSKPKEAHKAIMARLDSADLVSAGGALASSWKEATTKAAKTKAAMEEFTGNLLRALLVAVLVNQGVPKELWPVTILPEGDESDGQDSTGSTDSGNDS